MYSLMIHENIIPRKTTPAQGSTIQSWRLFAGDSSLYPPKIHNLLRLMPLANMSMDRAQCELLTKLNRYCLEGRYAASLPR